MWRRSAAGASNPQDLSDALECGRPGRDDNGKGKNGKGKKSGVARRPPDVLSALSPLSRRIVGFVAPGIPPGSSRAAECLAVASVRILPWLLVLVAVPLLVWDDLPAEWGILDPYPLARHLELVWRALLRTSIWWVAALTCAVAARAPTPGWVGSERPPPGGCVCGWSPWRASLMHVILLLAVVVLSNIHIQLLCPHAFWNPGGWFRYRVYRPKDIAPSLEGACLDTAEDPGPLDRPLCLSEKQWNELSCGELSSQNPDDVLAVLRGLDYLQNESGGLIVNILARNVADTLPALRRNVEGLVPFLGASKTKLSIVVYENDSDDGTREALKAWAEEEARREEPRYAVDLMGCGPANTDCKMGVVERYSVSIHENWKASGVGKLGEFRQIVLAYILGQEKYRDHSHMIILDVDLGASLSPLGLIHTLGLEGGVAQRRAVASASSQMWPGSTGTINPPYDLSAFRVAEIPANRKVRSLHRAFCELIPPGDRWRNICDATSVMQLYMIMSADDASRNGGGAYEVASAFNGLTLYPLAAVRERAGEGGARYDTGDDGQRCEHVGFHLSLGSTMYVNPKWNMKLFPDRAGGPTGLKAFKTVIGILTRKPIVYFSLIAGGVVCYLSFVYSWWRIAMGVKLIMLLLRNL